MATIHYVINTDVDGNESTENPLQVKGGPAATYIPEAGDKLMITGKSAVGFFSDEAGNISEINGFLSNSTGLTSSTLTDTSANFGATNAQVGERLNPNLSENSLFNIIASTATTLTVSGNMLIVASLGNPYAIVPAAGDNVGTSTDFPQGFMQSHSFIAVLVKGGAKQGIVTLANGTTGVANGSKIAVTGPHATEGTETYTQAIGAASVFKFFKKFTGETS